MVKTFGTILIYAFLNFMSFLVFVTCVPCVCNMLGIVGVSVLQTHLSHCFVPYGHSFLSPVSGFRKTKGCLYSRWCGQPH
jgi:hypothetical protein